MAKIKSERRMLYEKRFPKLLSFALVCMLVGSMAIPASAVQIDENGRMFGIKVGQISDMQTTINSSGNAE